MKKKIAVIGGGAAGFFAALRCKSVLPEAEVTIFEKSNKFLSKVRISGGGRCNVTHACFQPSVLATHYPRGGKFLKKAFSQFHTEHTVQWFEARGVPLKTEDDNRMFPRSNRSESIVDCLVGEAQKLGVKIVISYPIHAIQPQNQGFKLTSPLGDIDVDKVIVATGGSPKASGFEWLKILGHQIEAPVPSLFTFNMPKDSITELMGVVASNASIRIQGQKLKSKGPLLITHWGMSGPAVLKLSAFAARDLNQMNYAFNAQLNWVGEEKEEVVRKELTALRVEHAKRSLGTAAVFDLPKRLWHFLLAKREINPQQTWSDLPKKEMNRLIDILLNDVYRVKGKTTFKEEFVTSGGIVLAEVDVKRMESKLVPGLHFCGEVLNVDGITGGFNFQAAWTTGFVAGHAAARF